MWLYRHNKTNSVKNNDELLVYATDSGTKLNVKNDTKLEGESLSLSLSLSLSQKKKKKKLTVLLKAIIC